MKAKNNMSKRAYFAFPYAVISVVFVVIPLFFILLYAFKDQVTGKLSLNNFANFFKDVDLLRTIGTSFSMAFLTTLICFVLSYPLALALIRIKSRTSVLVMIFVLPMWINSLLRIYAVRIVFYEALGPTFLLVLIGMVYDFFPFMLLPIYTVLANTDKSVIEASADLGASPLQTLFKVRLPLSVPGIISGCLMVFMPTISTFAVSDILASKLVNLFGNLIYNWFDQGRYGYGSAYSIVLMLLIALFVWGATKLSKGKASASTAQTGGTV